MKIGILTHHYVSNFGAYLQGWCLRDAVARLYPEAEVRIIDYVLPKHALINKAGMLRFSPKRESLAAWLEKVRLIRTFAGARRDALPMTRRVHNADDIRALGLDAILVGSDEVWNYADARSFGAVKFGVGLADQRLIAYAPSVGLTQDFTRMDPALVEGLRHFHALSGRDSGTLAMLREKVGVSAAHVLDPVFLSPIPPAETERIRRLTAQPYALFYHFGASEQATGRLFDNIRAKGLKILGAGEYNKQYDALSVDLTPFEWAHLFRKAACVYTGTFHGVVLSTVNHVPFLVCPNNPTRVLKVRSLLEDLGLSGQLIDRDASVDALPTIDFHATDELLTKRREESLLYLRQALD